MHRLHLFVYFVLYFIDSNYATNYICDPTISCGCSTAAIDITARIVGGQIAPDNAWAWAVPLRLSGELSCGAALIAPEYALTAAHCVVGVTYPSTLTILAGTNYLYDTSKTVQQRQILNYVIHPNYNSKTHLNDIAVLRFSPLDMSSNSKIRFICLPTANTDVSPVGSNVIAVGWGVQNESSYTMSDYLRQVTLQILSPTSKKCQDGLLRNATTQICSGVDGGGKGMTLLCIFIK